MSDIDGDIDNDGIIDERERVITERKIRVQRRVAIAAFVAIIVTGTGLVRGLGFNWLDGEDISSLSTFLGWYFTILGGIVATYMGGETYLSKK